MEAYLDIRHSFEIKGYSSVSSLRNKRQILLFAASSSASSETEVVTETSRQETAAAGHSISWNRSSFLTRDVVNT